MVTTPVKNPPTMLDWFNYVFTYFPVTNWQHAFSPVINFGTNIEDAPEEDHVVNTVGSYGFQLNRIIDALQLIVNKNKKGLNAKEQKIVNAFLDMAKAADEAAKEFKGETTEESVSRLIEGMRVLARSDKQLYDKLLNDIQRAFPHVPRQRRQPKKLEIGNKSNAEQVESKVNKAAA